mmetsp:Transcript_45399/g.91591  ORF Transcript_45399/g.91591 Transcript_45399/m.91591 type:complete len:323 (+) Transcript_45399:153-1121(+)
MPQPSGKVKVKSAEEDKGLLDEKDKRGRFQSSEEAGSTVDWLPCACELPLYCLFGLSPFRVLSWSALLGLVLAGPALFGLLRASLATMAIMSASFGVDDAAAGQALATMVYGLGAVDLGVALLTGCCNGAASRVALSACFAIASALALWSSLLVYLLLVVAWAISFFVCFATSKGPCIVALAGASLDPSQYTSLAAGLRADLAALDAGLQTHAGMNLGLLDEATYTLRELEEELDGLAGTTSSAEGAADAKEAYLGAVHHLCDPFAAAADTLAVGAACAAVAMLGQVLLLVSHHTTYTVWYAQLFPTRKRFAPEGGYRNMDH